LWCYYLAMTHEDKFKIDEIRYRQWAITCSSMVSLFSMATFGTAVTSLNVPVTSVIILTGIHTTLSATYKQKIVLFSFVLFNVCLTIMGASLMGYDTTDYSYVYTYGRCQKGMDCLEEDFKPEELSIVCDPADGGPTVTGWSWGNATEKAEARHLLNITRNDIQPEWIDWFGNMDPSCEFVQKKTLWRFKQIFFLLSFLGCMMIVIYKQNKAEREAFYHIYAANMERFQVKRALKKALSQVQFTTDQFQMIEDTVLRKHLGSEDPMFELQINTADLVLGKVLGKGAQGVVIKGSYKGIKVAVKTLITISKKDLEMFRQELILTKSLKHPNIVKMVGISVSRELLGAVLEFADYGTMEDCVEDRRKEKNKAPYRWHEQKYKWMEGLCCGLAYLHRARFFDDEKKKWEVCVVHRDMKPANILITDTWSPKISDFGCSRFRKEDINMTQIGTPIFAAPEVILGDKYNEKCDIYSFAIIMLGLIYNQGALDYLFLNEIAKVKKPRYGRRVNNIMRMVSEGMRPALPDDKLKCPDCISELIQQCWLQDPSKRPSAVELVKILRHIVQPQLMPDKLQNPDKDFDPDAALKEATAVRKAYSPRIN
ncbi:hypothetical protein TrRE_jg4950, partial [Triparma retinervis]